MRRLRLLEIILWCVSAVMLGAVVWMIVDREVFQAYTEWAFDRALETLGREKPTTTGDDLKEFTPDKPAPGEGIPHVEIPPPGWKPRWRPKPESVLGRIEIPRLGVRAMILAGTSDRALRRAVGYIEGTALPGEGGNTGLAGHRDTFFRPLRDIRKKDIIRVRTLGSMFEYIVENIQIVGPKDIKVLKPDGRPLLTLVTCYPFNYVGSAPKRFIVRARQIDITGRPK